MREPGLPGKSSFMKVKKSPSIRKTKISLPTPTQRREEKNKEKELEVKIRKYNKLCNDLEENVELKELRRKLNVMETTLNMVMQRNKFLEQFCSMMGTKGQGVEDDHLFKEDVYQQQEIQDEVSAHGTTADVYSGFEENGLFGETQVEDESWVSTRLSFLDYE